MFMLLMIDMTADKVDPPAPTPPQYYSYPATPTPINVTATPYVLEILPAYANIFPDLTNYQSIHMCFSTQIKGAFLEDFIGHPNKIKPIAIRTEVSYLVLAFPKDVLVTQIEYIGSRLQGEHSDLFVRKFNYMVFYRVDNAVANYFEFDLFRYLNDFRISKSLVLKKYSKKLSWIARSKAIDFGVNKDYSHYSKYYGKYGEIYNYFGLGSGGYENGMKGATFPDRTLQGWIGSPGHYAAMTWGASHFAGGVAFITDGNRYYAGSFSDLDKWVHEPFTFGEDFIFENAYETIDPVLQRNIFSLVGISIAGIISCIAIGVIVALSMKKYKQKKTVPQDVV